MSSECLIITYKVYGEPDKSSDNRSYVQLLAHYFHTPGPGYYIVT